MTKKLFGEKQYRIEQKIRIERLGACKIQLLLWKASCLVFNNFKTTQIVRRI